MTETWLSAQGDEAKTAELAPSGFDVKSFPRQSRSRGGGIATVYKSTLGSNIIFKTSFDFTHTSFEVVQASITLQHNTLHFFCLYRPPPNRRNNPPDSMFTLHVTNHVALHASVVHASGSGQLQANPHVAGPWLSPGKPTRRSVTTMGSNDLVVGKVHLLGQSYQRYNWHTGRCGSMAFGSSPRRGKNLISNPRCLAEVSTRGKDFRR